MLENYLKLLAIADCVKKWRKKERLPREGVEVASLLAILGLGFAVCGYKTGELNAYVYYVFSVPCFIPPVLWLIKPSPKWDLECGRLLEGYKPIDVMAFVQFKKNILLHETMRLEDAESWLNQEMFANQGIADVAESKAGAKYHFLYDKPHTGKGKGAHLEQEQ